MNLKAYNQEMIDRHLKIGQLLQKKALEALINKDLSKTSTRSLVDMIKTGVDIETLAREMESDAIPIIDGEELLIEE